MTERIHVNFRLKQGTKKLSKDSVGLSKIPIDGAFFKFLTFLI